MLSMSTNFTFERLSVSYWLSTYSSMFLWLKLFIRNNRLLFLDEIISGRTTNNTLVKGCKWRYGHTLHVHIRRVRCLKIYTYEVAHKVFFASIDELYIVPIIFLMMMRLWREFIWLRMWCNFSSCILAMNGGLCCGGCCLVSMSGTKRDVAATFGWVANHVRQTF